MHLFARLFLLTGLCLPLTSCGTASHFLGQASGLVNSLTSPVLGAIRLSDSPEGKTGSEAPPQERPVKNTTWRTSKTPAAE